MDEKRTMDRDGVLGSNAGDIPRNRIPNCFINSLNLNLGLQGMLEMEYNRRTEIYLLRGHAPQEEIDIRSRVCVGMIVFADRAF